MGDTPGWVANTGGIKGLCGHDKRRHIMAGVDSLMDARSLARLSDLMILLHRSDVDLELKDEDGYTLLHRSVKTAGFEGRYGIVVIDILLEYGASPFTLNNAGHTTMYTAVRHNNTDIIHTLHRRGVDANLACTRFGTTPLHAAAIGSYVDVVKLLLDIGVDQSRRDHQGWTALDIAREAVRFRDIRATENGQLDSQLADRHLVLQMLELRDRRLAFAMSTIDSINPDALRLILDAM